MVGGPLVPMLTSRVAAGSRLRLLRRLVPDVSGLARSTVVGAADDDALLLVAVGVVDDDALLPSAAGVVARSLSIRGRVVLPGGLLWLRALLSCADLAESSLEKGADEVGPCCTDTVRWSILSGAACVSLSPCDLRLLTGGEPLSRCSRRRRSGAPSGLFL